MGLTFRRVYEVVTEIRCRSWKTKTTEASWHRGFTRGIIYVSAHGTSSASGGVTRIM